MKKEILKENNFYRCSDLSLSSVLFLFYKLEAIDRPPDSRKAYFLFKRENGLDDLVESYWRKELKVEPQAYFQALRAIKARLYSEH